MMLRALLVCLWGLCPGVWATAATAQAHLAMIAEAEAQYLAAMADQAARVPPAGRFDPQARLTGAALSQSDLRLVLVRIARPQDIEDHALLRQALGPDTQQALVLEHGTAELSALLAEVARTRPAALGPDGLRIPLVIEQGARLRIGADEVLRLDRRAGAFVINFGQLEVTGGGIQGAGPENPRVPEFAPFVLTYGRGSLTARQAYFADLGFGFHPMFCGLSVFTNTIYGWQAEARIEDSRLVRVNSLFVTGTSHVSLRGNTIVDAQRSAVILRKTRGAQIADSLFLGGASGDSIRLRDAATDTRIENTRIFRPRENGIAVQNEAGPVLIRDVTIWQSGQAGLFAVGAHCVVMTGLRVLRAGHDAVALAQTTGVRIHQSVLAEARQAGLDISGLPREAATHVQGTVFARNRVGIETLAAGRIDLRDNSFQDQFPRFLAGDMSRQTPRLLQDLGNETPLVLAAVVGLPGGAEASACLDHEAY